MAYLTVLKVKKFGFSGLENHERLTHMNTILLMLPEDQITAAQLQEIQKIAPEKRLLLSEDRTEIDKVVAEIEIASGWVPRDLMGQFQNLRWLQQWGAGADWLLDHPEIAQQDLRPSHMFPEDQTGEPAFLHRCI